MDAILKAVRKSPRPFGRQQGSSAKPKTASSAGGGKHKKFCDRWGEEKEPVKDGVTFYLKYIGSTLVEELTEEGASYGDKISAGAVTTIVNMAKLGAKKLPKMAVTVSTRGIKVINMASKEVKADITIYRINFCTADKTHDKVFAFIARNMENETMECSAFLCPKRKVAQAVTLTVAQAFSVAQEEWEEKEFKEQHNKHMRALSVQSSPDGSSSQSSGGEPQGQRRDSSGRTTPQDLLGLGLGSKEQSSPDHNLKPVGTAPSPVHMGFEDNFVEEDEFSCLAQSRIGRIDKLQHFNDSQGTAIRNPFMGRHLVTGLRAEDLDEGVEQLLNGQTNPDSLTRQPSVDDLLML